MQEQTQEQTQVQNPEPEVVTISRNILDIDGIYREFLNEETSKEAVEKLKSNPETMEIFLDEMEKNYKHYITQIFNHNVPFENLDKSSIDLIKYSVYNSYVSRENFEALSIFDKILDGTDGKEFPLTIEVPLNLLRFPIDNYTNGVFSNSTKFGELKEFMVMGLENAYNNRLNEIIPPSHASYLDGQLKKIQDIYNMVTAEEEVSTEEEVTAAPPTPKKRKSTKKSE